jgi:hypothetical protein
MLLIVLGAYKPSSHLINASTKLSSSRGNAFQQSAQHSVRSGQLTYESFVAKQTVAQIFQRRR